MAIGRPPGGKNRYHSKDFKLEVVNRALVGEGCDTLAKEYDLSASLISKWIRTFREKGPSGLENKRPPGNPLVGMCRKKNMSEVDLLRYELAKAQVELAKLKKAYEVERSVSRRKK